MPEAITAYRCVHKCGRVRVKRSAIAHHEAICFRNPAVRACQTCAHQMPAEAAEYCDGRMTYEGCGPWCGHELADDNPTPRKDCPLWANATQPEETDHVPASGEMVERKGGCHAE